MPSTTSLLERARAYLATVDPAISGSGGHDRLFRAAMVLVEAVPGLSKDEALPLLREYSRVAPLHGRSAI